jgi:hypothetical protein
VRRGEWNDLAAVLDWLGSADLSCRPINAYGRERRGEPHNLSLFALLILFDIACHAARMGVLTGLDLPQRRCCQSSGDMALGQRGWKADQELNKSLTGTGDREARSAADAWTTPHPILLCDEARPRSTGRRRPGAESFPRKRTARRS